MQESRVQQVVIVDDCSTDGTLAAARRCAGDSRVTVKSHATNQGKGAAIRTGLAAITAPLVIIQDADLEYDPADYGKLISPILRGRADVVYGIRGFAGHSAYSYWFVIGIRLSTDQSLFGQPDPYHAERLDQLTASLLGGSGDSRGALTHEQLPGDKG